MILRGLDRLAARFAAEPARVTAAAVLLSSFLWAVSTVVSYHGLRFDTVELMLFGQEWRLGYPKHPPLPMMLQEPITLLTGRWDHAPVILSAACTLATALYVWRLGRAVADPVRAGLGVLLLFGVFYLQEPVTQPNHNVVQMPFWTAAVFYVHRLLTLDRPWRTVAALGVAVAGAAWSKYAVVFLAATIVLMTVSTGRGRRLLATPYPYAAALLAAGLTAPHLLWLAETGFTAFGHAFRDTVAGPPPYPGRAAGFLGAQLGYAALAIGLAVVAGFAPRGRGGAPLPLPARAVTAEDRAFLITFALVPPALLALVILFAGTTAEHGWAHPMCAVWGLALVAVLAPGEIRAPRLLAAALVALVAGWPVANAVRIVANPLWSDRPTHAAFPSREMAAAARAAWRDATGGAPLRLVGGHTHLAGMVSVYAPERPSYAALAEAETPWAPRARVLREGMLFLIHPADLGRAAGTGATADVPWPAIGYTAAARGTLRLTTVNPFRTRSVVVGYLVVAPSPP